MCRFQSELGLKLSRTSRVADIPRLNTIDGADSGLLISKSCGSCARYSRIFPSSYSTRTNTRATALSSV